MTAITVGSSKPATADPGAVLSEPLFQSAPAACRIVRLPGDLDASARERFAKLIRDAVARQRELADKCDTILAVQDVQVEKDRLLIQHERAAAAVAPGIVAAPERPDIHTMWWLTWCTHRALRAATAANFTHGGVQLGAVYRDQTGRIKLGDFGIAAAYEAVSGVKARRYVVCAVPPRVESAGRPVSGEWRVVAEDEHVELGWIAPYFGHELLEDSIRLNPKSDLFALGALLFVWATGVHPYGIELSDSTTTFYHQPEPYQLDELRHEWAQPFENERKGVAGAADAPVLAWSQLVQRLLSDDPAKRLDTDELLRKHADEKSWEAASRAISQALTAAERGQIDEFLSAVAPLAASATLPALWRAHLGEYVKTVESQKEVIALRSQLARRLDDAQKLLDAQDLDGARRILAEVEASPHVDDRLRADIAARHAEAERLQLVMDQAVPELVRYHLDMAREALLRGAIEEAEQYVHLVFAERRIPPALRDEAEKVSADIKASLQRQSQLMAELSQATVDRRAGKLDLASERLELILGDPTLPDAIAEQARLLKQDVEHARAEQTRFDRQLQEAHAAFEQADETGMRRLIDQLPDVRPLPDALAERRDALLKQLETLRAALQMRRTAEELFAKGDFGAVRKTAQAARNIAGLPALLNGELGELIARCDQAEADAAAAALETALKSIDAAEKQWRELNLARCRELLESALRCAQLDDAARLRAKDLLERCEATQTAEKRIERADSYLAKNQFDEAVQALLRLQEDTAKYPPKLIERIATRLGDAERQRKAFVEEETAEVRKLLVEARLSADRGDLPQAEERLGVVETSSFADDGMLADCRELRETLKRGRPAFDALAAVDQALEAGDFKRVADLLGRVPRDLPWARRRAEAAEARARAEQDRAAREAAQRVKRGLEAADAALKACDPAAAAKALAEIQRDLRKGTDEAARAEALSAEAAKVQTWLPKIEAQRKLLAGGDLRRAFEECEAHLKESGIPPVAAAQLKELAAQARKRIAARQDEIGRELESLREQIGRLKTRKRGFDAAAAVAPFIADPLATTEHKQAADAIKSAYAALPEPKSYKGLIFAGAGVATLALGVVGFLMFGPKPPPPKPITDEARNALQARAEQRARSKNVANGVTVKLTPPDFWPSTVAVSIEGRERASERAAADQPDAESLIDSLVDLILRSTPLALDPLQKAADQAAAEEAAGATPRSVKLSVSNDRKSLLAAIDGAAPEPIAAIAVGDNGESVPETWLANLRPKLKPSAVKPLDVAALQTQADQAAADEAKAVRGATPRTVKLRRSDDGTKLLASIDGGAEQPIADIAAAGGAETVAANWLADLRPRLKPSAVKPLDVAALQTQADQAAADEAKAVRGATPRAVKLRRSDDGTKLLASIDGGAEQPIADIAAAGGAETVAANWLADLRPRLKPAPVVVAPAAEMDQLLAAAGGRLAEVDPAVFVPLLGRVVEAKVAAYANKNFLPDARSLALPPADALQALARNVAVQVSPPDAGVAPTPLLFVEFFEDSESGKHYGLGWRVSGAGAQPALVGKPAVWSIADPASLSGDDLLPIIAANESAVGSSWGVVVGLGGRGLAAKRWGDVSFAAPRTINGLGWACPAPIDKARNAPAGPQPATFSSLKELFKADDAVRCDKVQTTHRLAGLWCVPSLGAGYKRVGGTPPPGYWNLSVAGSPWRGSRVTVEGRQSPAVAFAASAGLSVTMDASELPFYFEWTPRSGKEQLNQAMALCPVVFVD